MSMLKKEKTMKLVYKLIFFGILIACDSALTLLVARSGYSGKQEKN